MKFRIQTLFLSTWVDFLLRLSPSFESALAIRLPPCFAADLQNPKKQSKMDPEEMSLKQKNWRMSKSIVNLK